MKEILICDCKKLIDYKIPFKYENFIKRLNTGLDEKELDGEEKDLFNDLKNVKLLADVTYRRIMKGEFRIAFNFMFNNLERMQRSEKFLYDKYLEDKNFFIGAFFEKKIVGAIFGFERDGRLIISELAVSPAFHRRGIAKRLVEIFEKEAVKRGHREIRVGARDDALEFYKGLPGYKPFILKQYCRRAEEIKVEKADLDLLKEKRKTDNLATFQFIFSKKINRKI